MKDHEANESLRRGFADLWGVAKDGYRVVDKHVCPVVGGEIVRPGGNVGHSPYAPMARPELPRELAKAASGEEADVLEFVQRYGLLGYTQAWSFEEQAGIVALYRGGQQAEQIKAPGDPLSWFVAHARTARLVLDLLGALREGEAAVGEQIDRLTVQDDREECIFYTTATRGYLRPSRVETRAAGEPGDIAVRIVASVLNDNLAGISRYLQVKRQEGGRLALTPLFTPCNLCDCMYWHLADAAAGGWVRRCADPKCGACFVAKDERVKYCPPPMGDHGVSPCMNRAKQRRHRENQQKGRQSPRRTKDGRSQQ